MLAGGCVGGGAAPREAIGAFFRAVQDEDLDRLYCLVAGVAETGVADEAAARADFARWARERYDAYLAGRDAGRVELDGSGIALVKLFALGRGTFFEYGEIREPAAGAVVVELAVRFGYAHIDLSRFSPGTTLYFAARPLGGVRAVRVPEESAEVTAELLESIRIRLTLVEAAPADGCPGGLALASAEPIPGTETTAEVTWIF